MHAVVATHIPTLSLSLFLALLAPSDPHPVPLVRSQSNTPRVPSLPLYCGGPGNVLAISGCHPSRSLPKISAATLNSLPPSNSAVRMTILSPMTVWWW